MQTAFRIFYALNLMGAFASTLLCFLLWKRRDKGLGTAAFLMMLTLTLWLIPNVLMWMVEDLPGSIFILKIGYIGALLLPAAWLIYAIFFIGKGAWLTPWKMRLLTVMPAFLIILVLTDQYWTGITLHHEGWVSYLEIVYSGWLNLGIVFSYTLVGAGIGLILWVMVRKPRLYRRRGLLLLAGSVIPLFSNILFFSDLFPDLHLDFTPLSFLFSGVILIWGGFRYQLFDVVPVAREALVDRVADGMVVLDMTGRVLDLNLVARQILGKTLYQARLKPLTELLPEMSPLLNHVTENAVIKNEITVQLNGRVNDYEVTMNPIVNRGGAPAGMLVVLHDITDLKRSERQLREALSKEKALAETRSRFVAVASHAFRTPLTTIKSSADMLETYSERWPEEKRREHLGRIRHSVTEMIHLLKRMLAFEQLQSGKIHAVAAEVDLVDLCQRVIRELPIDEPARAALRFKKHGNAFHAIQDEALLYQVLTNLLSNAFKYSPPGSPVHLDVWVEGQTARLEVRDQGIGIPAEDLPHLGEAFFRGANTNNIPGSGLGLLIVKRALQMMGGKLEVESSKPGGTRMCAVFPLRLGDRS